MSKWSTFPYEGGGVQLGEARLAPSIAGGNRQPIESSGVMCNPGLGHAHRPWVRAQEVNLINHHPDYQHVKAVHDVDQLMTISTLGGNCAG